MNRLLITLTSAAALAAGLCVATIPAFAQPCAASAAAAPGCSEHGAGYGAGGGSGDGTGMMYGGMMRGGRWGQGYTPGWTMMTPAERDEHRQTMSSFKTYEDCKAYVDRFHTEMAARAQARGMPMPSRPLHDACAGLPKASGGAKKSQ